MNLGALGVWMIVLNVGPHSLEVCRQVHQHYLIWLYSGLQKGLKPVLGTSIHFGETGI